MALTPRERVLCALNHKEPDRVPLFLGASGTTSVLGPGYEKLKAHLGVAGGPIRWLSKAFQYVAMDEEVMVRLGGDARPVAPGPAGSTLRREISPDCLIDDWGVTWRLRRQPVYGNGRAAAPPRDHRRPGTVSLAGPDGPFPLCRAGRPGQGDSTGRLCKRVIHQHHTLRAVLHAARRRYLADGPGRRSGVLHRLDDQAQGVCRFLTSAGCWTRLARMSMC